MTGGGRSFVLNDDGTISAQAAPHLVLGMVATAPPRPAPLDFDSSATPLVLTAKGSATQLVIDTTSQLLSGSAASGSPSGTTANGTAAGSSSTTGTSSSTGTTETSSTRTRTTLVPVVVSSEESDDDSFVIAVVLVVVLLVILLGCLLHHRPRPVQVDPAPPLTVLSSKKGRGYL